MSIDYGALKTEINSDPLALGYAGKTDLQVSEILNTVATDNLNAGRRIIRSSVGAGEIMACITRADFAALTANDKSYLQLIASCGSIDPGNANIVAAFGAMFSGQSLTNLSNVRYRPASRAETLFGERVEVWDVARARAL